MVEAKPYPSIKVRWNSKRGPQVTWNAKIIPEEIPHRSQRPEPTSSAASLSLDDKAQLTGGEDITLNRVFRNKPVAPPSPDYVPGPEHPPSPDYVPGPEHPPSPVYVPDPSYVADSYSDKDPKEDPEEDHANYPADGGDGNDEPSNDDDDDDDTDY
ncbi:hypothetical protein Tco_1006010 [Tanacetum coccineum]|uniref:Uncharacterized protein n=1 Tax=Tanacetum coccineum TaxID=301880 RepID=A0ABQ5FGS4_9ASTR